MMTRSHRLLRVGQNKGAALIIVLAFVVLLTGLVVAYFSRASTDRQLAQSSFNDTDADLLARSALDIVVGDFKQEIVNGSTATSTGLAVPMPTVYYSPTNKQYVVPQRNVAGIPNLIRISSGSDSLAAPAIGSRASAVNSSTNPSVNGRSVGPAKWNSHYLIPRSNPSDTTGDSTPTNTFVAPDWVIVTRNGPSIQTAIGSGPTALNNPIGTNTNYVIGRYAYAVYDEGGLLDLNVAGFPTPTSNPSAWTTDIGRKGVLAFADLTALPTTPGNTMSTAAINAIVGFRNYATATGTPPQSPWLAPNGTGLSFSFDANKASNIGVYYLGPVGTTASIHIGTSQDFGAVNLTKIGSGTSSRTDQNIVTRAELIRLHRSIKNLTSENSFSVNTLQYLGTFSREKNIATWRAGGTTTNKIESTLDAGRFYMGELDLIKPPTGNTQPANVQQDFRLRWKAGKANPPPASPGYWSYKGTTNPNALDHIPELSGPAGAFAGLLNYAMHLRSDDDYTNIGASLLLCANLIDQYDSNPPVANAPLDPISQSTTTTIAYNTPGGNSTDGNTWVYGIETNQTDANISKVAPSPTVPPAAPPTPIPGASPPGTYNVNRPFRSGGDLGYVINSYAPGFPTLDFYTAGSTDAPVLDMLTYNSALVRSGSVSLNTRQAAVLAAILRRAIMTDATSTVVDATNSDALNAAATIVDATGPPYNRPLPYGPALSRADIVRLASLVNTAPFNPGTEEVREAIPRALAEVVQTRTWGLLIDLVAQTGHYRPNATSLQNDFIVEGEKRYWLHVAIDRFDGSIVGQQLEEVLE
jgi:hypothetical protein